MQGHLTRLAAGRLAIAVVVATTTVVIGATPQRAGGAAQRKDNSELSRPGWLTLRIADVIEATPAERAIFAARWAEYDRLFIKPESLVRPQGFTVGPYATGSLSSPPFGAPHLDYSYIFFHGVLTTRGEGTGLLGIVENPSARDVWVIDSGGADFNDAQGDIFAERLKDGPLPGMPANAVVFNKELQFGSTNPAVENRIRVLLTADGESPWADVARERVFRILIARAEKDLKDIEQYASNSSYDKWLRDAPARQREHEQMQAAVAAFDKAQAAKMREDLDRVERLTGEDMKKNDAEQRERMAQGIAAARGRLTTLTGELAAMSVAERAAPAWIQVTSAGTHKFAPPNTPGFQHLIADKPDYYRFKGSRTQLRAMLVLFGLTNGSEPEMDRAVTDTYRAFDWAAAARLLNTSAK